MMDFYEVINKRHTVREWKEGDISQDVLEKIIAAGAESAYP